jgi:hypothetical protein
MLGLSASAKAAEKAWIFRWSQLEVPGTSVVRRMVVLIAPSEAAPGSDTSGEPVERREYI